MSSSDIAADAPNADLRTSIGEILDSLDPLGTGYDEPGEYASEAEVIAAGWKDAKTVDDMEVLVRTAFGDVSDHVADKRLYAVAAERLWMLKGHS